MLFHFVVSGENYYLNFDGDKLFSKELIAHKWYKVHFLAFAFWMIVYPYGTFNEFWQNPFERGDFHVIDAFEPLSFCSSYLARICQLSKTKLVKGNMKPHGSCLFWMDFVKIHYRSRKRFRIIISDENYSNQGLAK